MTAEASVLNSIGVALAADSAVSLGREKIYTSADKIFQLSCSAPIGAMIYGNASFVGLPWETVIKEYRGQLGDKRFDTVRGYAEDFTRFLGDTSHGMFPKEQQDRHTGTVVFALLDELSQALQSRMVEEIHAGKDVKEVDIDRLLAELIERYKKHVRSRRFLSGFTKADIASARKRYGKEIREIITVVLGPKAAKGTIGRALVQLGAETLCRDVVTDIRSGLVVAGFGEREYMPALIEYQLEEMALGKLRCVETRDAVIDSKLSSVVIPFAQQEMVYSFMEGIDKGLLEWMEGSTFDVLAGVVDEIVKKVSDADPVLGTELKKAMAPKVAVLWDKLLKGWMRRREEFWKPVLSTTRALPKDELAAMAEALVNLTKFRRRVTMDRETVGGPIDVAVITKGDGFVWVKRKHYFEAEYNPRVIARYQRGG